MSATTRFRMRLTSTGVSGARLFIDAGNRAIGFVYAPIRRQIDRFNHEAPWVFIVAGSGFCSFSPLLLYAMLQPYFQPDVRRLKEEERARQCLQKGVDPYPYLEHRDQMFGNMVPVTATSAEQIPTDSAEEARIMMRHYKRRKDDMESEDIETLRSIGELEKVTTITDPALMNWLAMGLETPSGLAEEERRYGKRPVIRTPGTADAGPRKVDL